jgi:hypothetical protein
MYSEIHRKWQENMKSFRWRTQRSRVRLKLVAPSKIFWLIAGDTDVETSRGIHSRSQVFVIQCEKQFSWDSGIHQGRRKPEKHRIFTQHQKVFRARLIFTLVKAMSGWNCLGLMFQSQLDIMRALKQSSHYRSTALSTHGISTLEFLDRWTHVGDCHVQIVVLEEFGVSTLLVWWLRSLCLPPFLARGFVSSSHCNTRDIDQSNPENPQLTSCQCCSWPTLPFP